MREYNIINRCLSILKCSRIDVITKLRLEKLLSALKMLLLLGVAPVSAPDLEELLAHVDQFCTGQAPGGVKGLVDHLRRVQTSLPGV